MKQKVDQKCEQLFIIQQLEGHSNQVRTKWVRQQGPPMTLLEQSFKGFPSRCHRYRSVSTILSTFSVQCDISLAYTKYTELFNAQISIETGKTGEPESCNPSHENYFRVTSKFRRKINTLSKPILGNSVENRSIQHICRVLSCRHPCPQDYIFY